MSELSLGQSCSSSAGRSAPQRRQLALRANLENRVKPWTKRRQRQWKSQKGSRTFPLKLFSSQSNWVFKSFISDALSGKSSNLFLTCFFITPFLISWVFLLRRKLMISTGRAWVSVASGTNSLFLWRLWNGKLQFQSPAMKPLSWRQCRKIGPNRF